MFKQTEHEHRKHFYMYYTVSSASARRGCWRTISRTVLSVLWWTAHRLSECSENFHKQLNAPFAIYADFEAIAEKASGCQPNDEKSYTQGYQGHTACIASVISSSVVMTISAANRWRPTAVQMLCTSLWKRCWRRSNGVRRWRRNTSTRIWLWQMRTPRKLQ